MTNTTFFIIFIPILAILLVRLATIYFYLTKLSYKLYSSSPNFSIITLQSGTDAFVLKLGGSCLIYLYVDMSQYDSVVSLYHNIRDVFSITDVFSLTD
ncbi:MAG: hypothetical protein EOP34_09320 [Rickettsiales bacterium]|nr:MAG: hypothetical protein EOP34_09320 [Rickettsiales bacterium]